MIDPKGYIPGFARGKERTHGFHGQNVLMYLTSYWQIKDKKTNGISMAEKIGI